MRPRSTKSRTARARLAALALVCACGPSNSPTSDGGTCTGVDALFAASDASSNAFGGFSLSGAVSLSTGVDLGKDAAFASSSGRAFFIARDLDTVVEIDAKCGTALSKISVAEPGRIGSTNPQDVGVASDGSLWVPRYQLPSVLVLGPGGARKTVDLSRFDSDGNPNLASIHVGRVAGAEKAFVAVQRIDEKDGYASRRKSSMVRIDVGTAEADMEVELAARNPFTLMVPFAGGLWLGSIGTMAKTDEADAGIERFDPSSMTTRLVVPEGKLGGSVIALALSEGCGAAIVADDQPDVNATAVVTFDPETGEVSRDTKSALLGPTGGYDLWAVAWVGNELLVADRRRVEGGYPIHRFSRGEGCALEAKPDAIFIGQKPVAIRSLPLPS